MKVYVLFEEDKDNIFWDDDPRFVTVKGSLEEIEKYILDEAIYYDDSVDSDYIIIDRQENPHHLCCNWWFGVRYKGETEDEDWDEDYFLSYQVLEYEV